MFDLYSYFSLVEANEEQIEEDYCKFILSEI